MLARTKRVSEVQLPINWNFKSENVQTMYPCTECNIPIRGRNRLCDLCRLKRNGYPISEWWTRSCL